MSVSKKKNSPQDVIDHATMFGGVIYVGGCRVFIDNPENFDVFDVSTGFWIMNAFGWRVYFKCKLRSEAQVACNALYGAGAYTVNSKS